MQNQSPAGIWSANSEKLASEVPLGDLRQENNRARTQWPRARLAITSRVKRASMR